MLKLFKDPKIAKIESTPPQTAEDSETPKLPTVGTLPLRAELDIMLRSSTTSARRSCFYKRIQSLLFSTISSTSQEVDYVILGAGSAGCVLANRLSEDETSDVAIFEAGPSDSHIWDFWKISMPSALTYNLADDKYNWDFYTVPQKYLNNRKIHQPRGRVLGGSSSLNAMVYIRGHALDYERWAHEEGAKGWSYSECLPYFKKAQSHEDGSDDYRGGDGPLEVTNGKTLGGGNELFDVFVRAANEVGYAMTNDLNGYRQEGFGRMDQTVSRNGVRCSASKAYLHPAQKKRKNLNTFTSCVATRILLSEAGGGGDRAVGVEYVDMRTKEIKRIHARKEVILSLGAVGSPHLLMLSGIGDESDLKHHDVEVKHHLPGVGQNLQDHLEFYMQYLCTKPVTLYPVGNWMPYPHKRILVGLEWFLRGTGWGASNQFETGGFIRLVVRESSILTCNIISYLVRWRVSWIFYLITLFKPTVEPCDQQVVVQLR